MELLLAPSTSKANEPDNMSAKMLKSTAVSIATVFTKFFNLLVAAGKLPSAWKTSSENKSDAKNYRPISLLPVTSTILDIHGKKLMHLQCAYRLSENQWRFWFGKINNTGTFDSYK